MYSIFPGFLFICFVENFTVPLILYLDTAVTALPQIISVYKANFRTEQKQTNIIDDDVERKNKCYVLNNALMYIYNIKISSKLMPFLSLRISHSIEICVKSIKIHYFMHTLLYKNWQLKHTYLLINNLQNSLFILHFDKAYTATSNTFSYVK